MTEIEDLSDELMKKQIMEWDEFTLFVRTHLYLEYYVNLVIEKLLPKQKELNKDPNFTTNYKLKVLHGTKFLSNVMYHNCAIMNNIRNIFAHNLKTNDESINSKIQNMSIPWVPGDAKQRLSPLDIYRTVSWTMVTEIKNALQQNRTAMFYPDETEYDKDKKKYL